MPPTKANGRFELPQIKPVNISLTDGTNIPPPLASPVEEKPPPPPISKASELGEPATPSVNGSSPANGATTRKHEPEPLSPTSTKRPSSIRRFLSRKSLHSSYLDGTNSNASTDNLARNSFMMRPESAMSFNPTGHKSRRSKSVGWFRKFSGKRTSIVQEEKLDVVQPQNQRQQPPPPTLPELNQLKAKVGYNDEGSLGGADLFKNIK